MRSDVRLLLLLRALADLQPRACCGLVSAEAKFLHRLRALLPSEADRSGETPASVPRSSFNPRGAYFCADNRHSSGPGSPAPSATSEPVGRRSRPGRGQWYSISIVP